MKKRLSSLNVSKRSLLRVLNDQRLPVIDRIESLEKYLLTLPQAEAPLKEYFGDRVYVRERLFKKGTFITGRVHKYDHVSIMVSGELSMWTAEDGLVNLKGYNAVRAKSGVKRVGFVVEDTLWITAHYLGEGVSSLNAEDALTCMTYREYLDFKNNTLIPYEDPLSDTRLVELQYDLFAPLPPPASRVPPGAQNGG
jgi:hypothetical protein